MENTKPSSEDYEKLKMDKWFWAFIALMGSKAEDTSKKLNALENELQHNNRFFPDNSILQEIDAAANSHFVVLSSGTRIFRARNIDKQTEEKFENELFDCLNEPIQKYIPDFDFRQTLYRDCLLPSYLFIDHPEEQAAIWNNLKQSLEKQKEKKFGGFDAENIDANPNCGEGRINPAGISYLYTASDSKTAALEVRTVPSQLVCIAEIEITDDVKLYSFDKNFLETEEQDHPFDWQTIVDYFTQPNYDGKAVYLVAQYISEYIKNIKDECGNHIFDGICFTSSLNSEGINYVLFETDKRKRKYKLKNTKVYQMEDLIGNIKLIWPSI